MSNTMNVNYIQELVIAYCKITKQKIQIGTLGIA